MKPERENPPYIEIRQVFEDYDRIILHRHVAPDGDALGSQFGLAEALRSTWADKKIYCVGENSPEDPWFPSADVPPDCETCWNGALAVVLDTANTPRIDDERWSEAERVIKIDHHPLQESFGDIEWVDSSYPSCAEMIVDLIRAVGLVLPPRSASALYYGIISDTGQFRYPGVGEETFHRAADLAAAGAEVVPMTKELHRQKVDERRFAGWVMGAFSVSAAGTASLVVEKDDRRRFGVSVKDAAMAVAHLGNLEGVRTWVLFVELDEEGAKPSLFRTELRSSGVAVNGVAAKYGGGGHETAAGCLLERPQIANLLEDLDKLADG